MDDRHLEELKLMNKRLRTVASNSTMVGLLVVVLILVVIFF